MTIKSIEITKQELALLNVAKLLLENTPGYKLKNKLHLDAIDNITKMTAKWENSIIPESF